MFRGRSVAASFALLTLGWLVAASGNNVGAAGPSQQPPSVPSSPAASAASPFQPVLQKYCITCHNQTLRTAGLALDTFDVAKPARQSGRLGAGDREAARRLDAAVRDAAARRGDLSRRGRAGWRREIDRAWAANPNPGRISAVHRLNRTEYNNAIRDLFALDLDVRSLLPGDETADGSFDNFADVLTISTAHLERYLSVARQVTRLATGLPPASPGLETFEIPLHVVQDDRQSEDLPFGSRGGIADPLRLSGRRRVPDQGPSAAAVSGLPHGHGLAAAARRPARRQAAEALHRRRRRARAGPPRPATPATANRALPAIPSGKSTCRSTATPDSRSACRSRRDRTSSACRSCGSCGSRKAFRSRCSGAGC